MKNFLFYDSPRQLQEYEIKDVSFNLKKWPQKWPLRNTQLTNTIVPSKAAELFRCMYCLKPSRAVYCLFYSLTEQFAKARPTSARNGACPMTSVHQKQTLSRADVIAVFKKQCSSMFMVLAARRKRLSSHAHPAALPEKHTGQHHRNKNVRAGGYYIMNCETNRNLRSALGN